MAKSKKQEVVMYTNNTCPYCKQIKELFDKEEIKFEEEWGGITSLTSMPTVPTIVYNDSYLVAGRDFGSPQNLVAILKNLKGINFPVEKQIFEKMKTLNYNMSVAFNRIDQLLKQIENKLNIEDEHKSTS